MLPTWLPSFWATVHMHWAPWCCWHRGWAGGGGWQRCPEDLSPTAPCTGSRGGGYPLRVAAEPSQNLSVWGKFLRGTLQIFETEVLTSCRSWPLSRALPSPKHNTPLHPCPTTAASSPGPGTGQRPQVLTLLFPSCFQTVFYVNNRERKFFLA